METRGVASITFCNYGFQPVVVKRMEPGQLLLSMKVNGLTKGNQRRSLDDIL